MAEKTINTRIKLKIDTLTDWNKSELKLKYGEVAFATTAASTGTGLSEPVTICKIGDGEKTFSQLPDAFYAKASDVLAACKSEAALASFINSHLNAGDGIALSFANNTVTIAHAVPTDASAGAKGSTEARTYLKTITTDKFGHITGVTTGQEFVTDHNTKIKTGEVTFGQDAIVDFIAGNNITLTPDSTKATLTVTGKDWSQEIKSAVAGLSGAMHFVGKSDTNPKETTGATVSGHTTWAVGDVVLYGIKEFVLKAAENTADNWIELGTEGDYAVKGSITEADFAEGATISASRVANLTEEIDNIWSGINKKVGTVKIDGTALTMDTDKAVNIPAASNTTLGAVKVDNTTIKSTNGTIAIKEVSTDLFVQGTDTLIFDCGGAN